ncbi:MAG: hypothetical protein HY832_00450 [Candidatus Aenigmarchaeota archaeon]|nr:hypothetical protein [Candidatus Aenigmarchaeota archaeon]
MFKSIKAAFSKEPLEITFDQLPVIMNQEFARELATYMQRAECLSQQIVETFSDLKELLKQLKAAPATTSFTELTKNNFCDRACERIDAITIPPAAWPAYRTFVGDAEEAMTLINNPSLKEFKQLHQFKTIMTQIASKAKTVDAKIIEFRKMLETGTSKKVLDVFDAYETIKERQQELAHLGETIAMTEKSIPFLVDEVGKNDREIEMNRLKLSELHELEIEIENKKTQLDTLSKQLDQSFSGMDKLFRLFFHQHETYEDTLKSYAVQPKETFLLHDAENRLPTLLAELEKEINNGAIDCDDKRKEHVSDLAKTPAMLLTLKADYLRLRQSIQFLNQELAEKEEPFLRAMRHAQETKSQNERQVEALREKRQKRLDDRQEAERVLRADTSVLLMSLSDLLNREIVLRS